MNPKFDRVKSGVIYEVIGEGPVEKGSVVTIFLKDYGRRTWFDELIFEPLEDEADELVEEVKETLKQPEPCL